MISTYKFLEAVSKLKTNQEKIDALKSGDCYALRVVLQAAFDPNIKFALPEGTPPYKPNVLVDQYHVLIREARKIVYFIDGAYPGLNRNKREMMFIEMLENVDKDDALLLCSIKDKKLPFKGIKSEHVLEALPGLYVNEQANSQEV